MPYNPNATPDSSFFLDDAPKQVLPPPGSTPPDLRPPTFTPNPKRDADYIEQTEESKTEDKLWIWGILGVAAAVGVGVLLLGGKR